ncbi:MAG: glutamate--tRNA ligase family protein [Planctomycetota bacterium]|nr:glutamate--tRNA ligase family protein [Planctomycetota bacterium]
MSPVRPTTRLAPSPTGALHLGNARTFLVNWALARRHGWHIVLRIEDLDTPRVKPGVIDLTIDLLSWLGIDWDEGPYIQSTTPQPHIDAMQTLAAQGLIYPCDLTRTQIEAAASAPQEGSGEIHFPASLRPATMPATFTDDASSWRFAVDESAWIEFDDLFAGAQRHRPAATIGDFILWTRRDASKPGQAAYQLAVVVDDARQGITHIVRGDDLLDSAARQILLYRALGLGPEPQYCHLPLVKGTDGKRLAKRHGDTRLDTYRAQGTTPERVIGLVAFWCGVQGARNPMAAAEFRDRLDLSMIPPGPITFTGEDDRWLRS